MPSKIYANSKPLEPILWSAENPRSMLNLVPKNLQATIKNLYVGDKSHLLFKSENALHRELVWSNRAPEPVDHLIRYYFWLEYDHAQLDNKPEMEMKNVYRRLMAPEVFFDVYTKNIYRLAWMLNPPLEYTQSLDEALTFGVRMLRGYLELDGVEKGTEGFKERVVVIQMRIIRFIEDRLRNTDYKSVRKASRLYRQKDTEIENENTEVKNEIEFLIEDELVAKEKSLLEREAKLAGDTTSFKGSGKASAE